MPSEEAPTSHDLLNVYINSLNKCFIKSSLNANGFHKVKIRIAPVFKEFIGQVRNLQILPEEVTVFFAMFVGGWASLVAPFTSDAFWRGTGL